MIKFPLLAVAGFLALILPLSAETKQPSPRPLAEDSSAFSGAEVVPTYSRHLFASLTLGDSGFFSFPGAFGWMDSMTPAFLPAFNPVEPRRTRVARARSIASPESYSYGEIDAGADRFEVHGEVGFLYGRYTGKHGGDFTQAYVIGEVGNDKFHLTVGASHQEFSGSGPRRGR